MKIYNLLLFIALFVLFLLNPFKNLTKDTAKISIEGLMDLQVEIADTPAKRSKGLMFRKPLSKNEGMFFVFSNETRPSFYNKNVSFDVLVLWINKNYKIVGYTILNKNSMQIHKPSEPIKYVLELNAEHFSNPEIFLNKSLKLF